MSLSEIESAELARLLKKMEWPLPRDVFYALVPNIKTVAIELGIFNKKKHILMTQRPAGDPEFLPGSWHVPGTVLYPDDSMADALKRLLATEICGNVSTPVDLGWYEEPRSIVPSRPALAILHAGRVVGDYNGKGTFFPVDQLPENTLPHHKEIIPEIVKRCRGWF